MGDDIHNAMSLLCSSSKLERDKGVLELERLLQLDDTVDRNSLQKCLEAYLISTLTDSGSEWEIKHGCLLGAKSLVPYLNVDDQSDLDFMCHMKCLALSLLTDVEARVRLAAGEVVGVLCNKLGPEVYKESKESIIRLVKNNLERIIDDCDNSSKKEQYDNELLMEKLMGGPSFKRRSLGETVQVFQENAGWRNLETSLKVLQSAVEGCGVNFLPFIDEELLNLLFKTLSHSNRFVRETGFNLCSSIVKCRGHEEGEYELQSPIFAYGHELSKHLGDGLADNWSQVKMSASIATRYFLLSLPEDARHMYYPLLLPRMCLNRYYVADGVRIYSQETWRQVTGSAGKEHVEKYMCPTVEYYQLATTSEHHAIREAACACIAELACKIPVPVLGSFVNSLLSTLLSCFQDDSWPVRDSACLACGNFVLCFPEESRGTLEALLPMFYRNLGDSIASVRQGAASALCNVLRAYGESCLPGIIEHIHIGFQGLENQSGVEKIDEESIYSSRYGAGKRLRNDNEVSYGCDSLAPKLSRGHSSEKICLRPSQPWELADGCVYLIGELSSIKEAQNQVLNVLPLLKLVTKYQHYSHHVVLLETICKQLPIIAKNLGKKTFSNIADEFFVLIFLALESENGLTSSAASQCLNQLATFLGQNVLRAKVGNYHPRYVRALESVIYIAPF